MKVTLEEVKSDSLKTARHMEEERQGSKRWDTLLRTRFQFSGGEGLRGGMHTDHGQILAAGQC